MVTSPARGIATHDKRGDKNWQMTFITGSREPFRVPYANVAVRNSAKISGADNKKEYKTLFAISYRQTALRVNHSSHGTTLSSWIVAARYF